MVADAVFGVLPAQSGGGGGDGSESEPDSEAEDERRSKELVKKQAEKKVIRRPSAPSRAQLGSTRRFDHFAAWLGPAACSRRFYSD